MSRSGKIKLVLIQKIGLGVIITADTGRVCFGFFGAAVLLHQKNYVSDDVILMEEMKSLIEESYWCQLNQLPKQEWAEYFDGPTGTWVGQQSRTYQTWTIVGFLLMNHFLREEDNDLDMFMI